jgi:SAM-dependent methyltransferase
MAVDKPVQTLIPLARRECEARQNALIAEGKSRAPFGPVDWDCPYWDVTAAYAKRNSASKGRPTTRLLFTQHRPKSQKKGVGEPFTSSFSNLVKALVCRRASAGRGSNSHQIYINAFRYIYDVLKPSGRRLIEVTHADFDLAWDAAHRSTMKQVTLVKFKGHLENVAGDIDRYRIAAIRLNWSGAVRPHRRSSPASPPARKPGAASLDKAAKLPSEDIYRAVGWLYQHIPRDVWPDRVLICLTTISCFLGYRSADLRKLPSQPVQYDANRKAYYLVRYGSKRGNPGEKIIPTAAVEIVSEAVAELLSLTRDVRATATWLRLNPGKAYLGRMPEQATLAEAAKAMVGFASAQSAGKYLEKYGVAIINGCVAREEVEFQLGKLVQSRPCETVLGGTHEMWLKDCLAIAFIDGMHRGTRWTKEYSVKPITHGQLYDFLCGKGKKASVFERYDLRGAGGEPLRLPTHGPRHFVNDLLDRGGMPELVQAEWFGRKHISDNKAYQHKTDVEYAEEVRDKLNQGALFGKFAEQVAKEPVERREAVIAAKIHFVHKTEYGMCIRDFSQMACDLYGQCLQDCESHLIDPFDDMMADGLKEKRRFLLVALRSARRKLGDGVYGADSALNAYRQELVIIRKLLRRRAAGAPTTCCGKG